MYKCEKCEKQVGAGIPCYIKPLSIRTKVYHINKQKIVGWEIEKEIKLCPSCAADYEPPEATREVIEFKEEEHRLNYKKIFKKRRSKRTLHTTQIKRNGIKKKHKKKMKRRGTKKDEWKNYKYRG